MTLRHIFLGLFILLNILVFCCVQVAYAENPEEIGHMVWVKGTVKAVDSNKKERVLQRRSPIYAQDTVATDKSSTGEIVFTDNSMVSLNPETDFRVDQYKFDHNNPTSTDRKYVASLVKGGFRTVTGLIPKGNPDNYQVNTPVATVGVRGTDYQVSIRNGSLYLKLNAGAIVVQNAEGKLELNALKDKLYATVGAHGAPVLLKKLPDVFTTTTTPPPSLSNPNSSSNKPSNTGKQTVDNLCIQ